MLFLAAWIPHNLSYGKAELLTMLLALRMHLQDWRSQAFLAWLLCCMACTSSD